MQTKEHGFEAKAASEFARLRKFQADLEEETGNACFVGLSVVGTAQQCVRLGNARAANRVQSEFRLSERRFWWLKVELIFNPPPPPPRAPLRHPYSTTCFIIGQLSKLPESLPHTSADVSTPNPYIEVPATHISPCPFLNLPN